MTRMSVVDQVAWLLSATPTGEWVTWKTCSTAGAARQAAYHLRNRVGILEGHVEVRTQGAHVHVRRRKEKEDIPTADTRPDWEHTCMNCGARPIVPATGLCGPCTFGEADTAGGNW
jgi:hypothetical protein